MHTIVLMLSAHFHITRPARSGGQLGPELDHGACRIGSPIRPRHTADCAGAN
ncbi:uncharacterized protein CLUP02_04756 [Colletotrichum lupini]|uniref:Uncharacterized protein n=1 Tax=Colletotrichum lupini TaxID=145971 RepID=A0A9Q8SMP4_9PEZI|nr:uncharacterized protein CLUP02_04756 [Colletotrichum lupini]UQC79277.1 hypothetical protein CLUP02_04756 [Colletotrichum lupini]